MKYVVTGGCGFIGTNLIKHIFKTDKNAKVTIVDNLINGKESNKHPKAELIIENIKDYSVAMSVCKGADIVIHLAAETGVVPSVEDPKTNFETNAIGTFNYIEASRLNKVGRFIFASSGSVLGDREPPVDEYMLPNPVSPYGAGKLMGEAYCSAYYHSFGLEAVALRFANAYGPHGEQKDSIVHKFIKYVVNDKTFSIYGDGKQTRDLIYVEDLVEAVVKAAHIKKSIGGEVFQLATSNAWIILNVVEELQELCKDQFGKGTEVIFEDARAGEIVNYYCSIDKAVQVLRWEPKYELDEGLEKTVKWFGEYYGIT